MTQWHIHTKVLNQAETTTTRNKFFKKKQIEQDLIKEQKQFFENKNAGANILSIEVNKIYDFHSFKTSKKPVLGFFNRKNHSPARVSQYSATLKLQLLNHQAMDKLNSLLKDPDLKYYVANQKKNDLETTFSGGLENAMIVLGIINKEFPDSQFSPKMRQALIELFFKDPNSKEALDYKNALENFAHFNPNAMGLPHHYKNQPIGRLTLYW